MFWKAAACFWFLIALGAVLIITEVVPKPLFLSRNPINKNEAHGEGFEIYEGINFAREFSERSQSFEPKTYKISQIATAFLLDDESRARRIAEIDRLEDKIVRGQVMQRGRLISLLKLDQATERFVADLAVELTEGSANVSEFQMRLSFALEHVDRSAQNPWGFRVRDFKQDVILNENVTADAMGTAPFFNLRAGTAVLVRFPCSIENVELPKGTSVRVKLTTFDISELQLKSDSELTSPQTVRAVCKDKSFTMNLLPESQPDQPLTVLRTLTMANAVDIAPAAKANVKKPKRAKLGVEKSVEEQLGFVIEE